MLHPTQKHHPASRPSAKRSETLRPCGVRPPFQPGSFPEAEHTHPVAGLGRGLLHALHAELRAERPGPGHGDGQGLPLIREKRVGFLGPPAQAARRLRPVAKGRNETVFGLQPPAPANQDDRQHQATSITKPRKHMSHRPLTGHQRNGPATTPLRTGATCTAKTRIGGRNWPHDNCSRRTRGGARPATGTGGRVDPGKGTPVRLYRATGPRFLAGGGGKRRCPRARNEMTSPHRERSERIHRPPTATLG